MAAAKARRGLAFFTFGDEQLKRDLEQIYCLLRTEGTTVGEFPLLMFKVVSPHVDLSVNISPTYRPPPSTEKLYKLLEDFCDVAYGGSHVELFDFIRNSLKHSRSLL